MGAVVTDVSAGFLADLPGRVLAKTGTAEYGTKNPLQTHAWDDRRAGRSGARGLR